MSNFGTLYRIDTIFKMKNKYPIVSETKDYIYYKVYGNKEYQFIHKRPKKNELPIISLDEYYKIINHRKDFNGFVFVPAHEKEYPILPKQYFWEQTLEELNEKAEKLISEINYMQHIINLCSKNLNYINEDLSKLSKERECKND